MSRVLVVDDDPAALEIRKLVIERHGHQVLTAADRESALATVDPEVVIVDLRLPRPEDGLALIREFHARRVRIIVLCGNRGDLDGHPEAAMADQILSKPVRSEVILQAIQAF